MGLNFKKRIIIFVIFSISNVLQAEIYCDTLNLKNEIVVVCTTYYKNNQIERISSRLKGKRHGLNITYHKDGKIKRYANYNQGVLIDTAFGYYQNGKIRSIATVEGDIIFFENGDTMAIGHKKNGIKVGQRRMYYISQRPERFITYNDSGEKHGWEVFWYKNGNVKDSTLYNNGDVVKGTSFYHNGKSSLVENDLRGDKLISASSYDIKGKKTGQVKNGTGTIFTCDSVGGNCHELKFKNGKRVFR